MGFVSRYAKLRSLLFALSLYRCRTENVTLDCDDGHFQQSGVCRDCNNSCKRCISEFACTECKAGLYGDTCANNCSETCSDKICLQNTGGCVSCVKGFYVDNDRTCSKCPNHCEECSSQKECTICELGSTGTLCKEQCVNCKEGTGCTLFDGVCIDGCKDGYSGLLCSEQCALICSACDRNDKSKCKSCVKGKHGTSCEKNCPVNCVGNICEKDDGTCTNSCKEGYWGDTCEDICPINCFSNACEKRSGACLDGCRRNFSGSKCLCPSKCTCDSEGSCDGCSNKSEIICNDFCSKGCVNSLCWRNSAKCLDGCKEGYQGETCTQVPDGRGEDSLSSAILIIVSAISVCVTVVLLTAFCINKMRKRRNPMFQDRKEESDNLDDKNYSTIPDHLLERAASGEHTSAAQPLTPRLAPEDTSPNYFSSLSAEKISLGAYTALSNSPASRLNQESLSKPSAHTPAADKDALLQVSQPASNLYNTQATKTTVCTANVSTEAYITPLYTVNVDPSGHQASYVNVLTSADTQDDYLTPMNST